MIRTSLPTLSKPQATVLAWWSLGMGLARSCALTAVTAFLAPWVRRPAQTVRQQLREWCDEAEARRGDQRQAVDPQACFVPLLPWSVGQGQGPPLALAFEATTLGTRCTVLAISVVSCGCAMPVAWTLLPATRPHAWRREWLRLLRVLRPAIPQAWTVIVLADRGLSAGWLFRRIGRLGWHPCVRLKTGGTFRPAPQATCQPVARFVPRPGPRTRMTAPPRAARLWLAVAVATL